MKDNRLFSKFAIRLSISATTLTLVNLVCLLALGCSGGASTAANTPVAAAPIFSIATGTYASTQTVTLSDANPAATIYYTTDGTMPSTSSAKYATPLSIATTTTLSALAAASGYTNSPVAAATYTIVAPAAATPVISPAGGTFASAQTVTISDTTAGATILFTVDGSLPTASSTKYTAALTISSTTTVNAIAMATGYSTSAVGTSAYTITLPAAATPTFSPAGGTYTSAQTVTLADPTPGATIYYTIDGTTPTASSARYTGTLAVGATETVKAIALASGYSTSAVGTAIYTVSLPAAATPTFSPAGGNYASAQTVTISDASVGSTIYYTVDGTPPTVASTRYTGPLAVGITETVNAIAVASGYATSAVASATYSITGSSVTVNVVLSTHDRTSLMAPQSAVMFGVNAPTNNQVLVDDTQTYQTMDGFGASFTDSAAYLLEQVIPASALPGVLSDLFTRKGTGIGLSFMRLPMGASDLARSVYTFDDLSPGQTDPTLASFSIAHDQADILPLVLAARNLNPQMKIMANPWSPPGWMKSSDNIVGGTLLPAMYTPFANYFVKYIQAYQSAGVGIDYISLQNEPLYVPTNYPGMGMDPSTQTTLMRDFVLPAFTTAGIKSKLFVYDHNWDNSTYPETVLGDPTLFASSQVAGVAWHGYGGNPGVQQTVQNDNPGKGTWETEHSGGTFISDQFTGDFLEITQVLRNAAKAYVKWGLALDENLGPNLTNLPGYGGCNTCTPIVTVNSVSGAVTKPVEYYTLGHYSKYVLPGAVRVYSSNGITVGTVAFLNPDGSHALIAFNNANTPQSFQVQWGTQSFSYSLPAYAAATFAWSGTQDGTANLTPTNEIQASSYSAISGLQSETTTDITGAYDLGYVTNNSYAMYKSVAFGTSLLTRVNVRTASGGQGGTLEFRLDSATGTLLGTATLPVTGSYQTYTTVSAPITGASGTHDLYIVFHGSGGIANVNWFQFQ